MRIFRRRRDKPPPSSAGSAAAPTAIDVAERGSEALTHEEEPPVVARLVIEIRSDGSRTVARGGLEDVAGGDKVAIEARGTTPLALASSLAKSLLTTPLLARAAFRNMLTQRRDDD